MGFDRIAVLGLGKVGRLAATLLHESGFAVTGVDARLPAETLPFACETGDVSDPALIGNLFSRVDAVLSCLPFHLNAALVKLAHDAGIHYFDLTEDVPTTNGIIELAKSARGLMAPQCGLAPGFIGIVGASLADGFDRCRSIRMRVGALPQNPTGLLGYAFNWSPEGVVNEYLNDCEVIEGGVRKLVSPMEWHETLYVNGVKLEAFTTSGGLGTMCATMLGRVENLDYKTIRYPGHMELMNFFFHELLMRDRRKLAGEILTEAKPPVDDDVVYVHVSAEGTINGNLRRKEFVRAYYPIEIAGESRTAISWTTSASVVAVIELVRAGRLPSTGFLHQEHIPLDMFLETRTGSLFKGGATHLG
ncbi:L-lysine dehydrogenase [Agrobacterium rhizogenes]|uniref:saccharopine dehydrogenase family protein n=1 Tax=Rhizobium rhizogenes TaxID=359 RepID=UPI001571AB5C|nr:saccharopine dehydrogenase C-terminal domain-containing protein [Rhizobium rhizogenes]NTF85866.1 L-lysine dehydrogenase [Rhizobium rhizogenes]